MSLKLDDLRSSRKMANELIYKLQGIKSEQSSRLFKLSDSVSKSKAFLLLKDDTINVLENFQLMVHARTVGTYERLLTSLVQDIIQDGSQVKLELSSENGVSSLDILVEKNGHRFSIIDSEGGALTNVVSMGLRLIATLRSGSAPFLLLDEADCWVEVEKIPDFYGALASMSDAMGLQVIAVTHHPVSLLEHCNPRIFKVSGDPLSSDGVSLSIVKRGREYNNSMKGIRSVRLENFAGYGDVTFDLSPGLNVITGKNNVGKSRINRALKAVCYGDGNALDVRIKKTSATVTVTVENNQSIEWSRDKLRTPVTLWKKKDDMGIVSSGARSVPPWVDDVIGIAPRNGLDIQLGHQKNSVFLLNESGKQKASVLSVGKESGILQDMMKLYRSDIIANQANVRNGEKDVSLLMVRIESMAELDNIQLSICSDEDISIIAQSENKLLNARKVSSKLSYLLDNLIVLDKRSKAITISSIPVISGSSRLLTLSKRIETGKTLIEKMDRKKLILDISEPLFNINYYAKKTCLMIRSLNEKVIVNKNKLNLLNVLSEPVNNNNFIDKIKFLVEKNKIYNDKKYELELINKKIDDLKNQWKEIADNINCPLCGNDIKDIDKGHVHG